MNMKSDPELLNTARTLVNHTYANLPNEIRTIPYEFKNTVLGELLKRFPQTSRRTIVKAQATATQEWFKARRAYRLAAERKEYL